MVSRSRLGEDLGKSIDPDLQMLSMDSSTKGSWLQPGCLIFLLLRTSVKNNWVKENVSAQGLVLAEPTYFR